jgi:hypothetical protein
MIRVGEIPQLGIYIHTQRVRVAVCACFCVARTARSPSSCLIQVTSGPSTQSCLGPPVSVRHLCHAMKSVRLDRAVLIRI